MPRYNPAEIEPIWQKYWEDNQSFKTPDQIGKEKIYVLDMFPYPSGDGLHVGHPEGYTATDIYCRYKRMCGVSVLHPMGFDSFGLPAEEHAIKHNRPPREHTEQNIATFRRQLKMLGFSYDWEREIATTDVEYFKWTQWIFLVLFDTWYDSKQQKGRPISELPIPAEIEEQGETAVRVYQDEHRLAYQDDALVNWCPALGTVLANEEVIDGKSERGSHPVQRLPLRQWMLRITAYADRLEKDLEQVNWPEGIRKLQRDWIGRSTGAEVDFFIGAAGDFESWKADRAADGFPRKSTDDALRVYTTRPDTLFGATYMVIAPEHPFVERLTTTAQRPAVEKYCAQASSKSDRERQEEKKHKTGVFSGSNAINPVNGEAIPIWIADYVLISYGTGAIMAVPAHDERDKEFAKEFQLEIRRVVEHMVQEPEISKNFVDFAAPYHFAEYSLAVHFRKENPDASEQVIREKLAPISSHIEVHDAGDNGIYLLVREPIEGIEKYFISGPKSHIGLNDTYEKDGTAINSSDEYNGLPTPEFKQRITQDLTTGGMGKQAVNYKLRDWLFSRQRFWGEPFPILKELDENGEPNGLLRAVDFSQLPVDLPHLDDYKPHGRPEPPLEKAPDEWLYPVIDGKRYKRETNTMPQWAGSCWYYLRFIDPRNDQAFVDPELEQQWMPVDLYVGGAEHAVLHLLYSRFWHKVLYDRGHVSTAEPFKRLINQGMILGEPQYHAAPEVYEANKSALESKQIVASKIEADDKVTYILQKQISPGVAIDLKEDQIDKRQGQTYLVDTDIPVAAKAEKMSKSRGNVINPDLIVNEYGADSLRLYEMFMGPLEATKPWSMAGVNGVRNFLDRAWRIIVDDRSDDMQLNPSIKSTEPNDEQLRVLHKTIKAVTQDIETLSYNTAIARMMEFVNFFTKETIRPIGIMRQFALLLSPFAPHLGEELWRILGGQQSLAHEPWPKYDEALTRDATVEIPVQIMGKVRAKINVDPDLDKTALEAAARADTRVAELLDGKKISKVIVVPGRLVNFVAS